MAASETAITAEFTRMADPSLVDAGRYLQCMSNDGQ